MELFIALLGDVGGMDYQESALGELRSGIEANIGRTRTGILPTELGLGCCNWAWEEEASARLGAER
ncbi:MAG: hypothetical protein BRC51_09735, partial [Cyanobacteria bacterium SW_12_48_29]